MRLEYPAAPRIAKFSKVSRERFEADFSEAFPNEAGNVSEIYESLKLPARATKGSAGYDFFMPVTVTLAPGETVKIPTGIRAEMAACYVLMLFPRSGLGFKYRLRLDNTVGIIDSDYYYSSNEGHILTKVTNCGKKDIHLEKGKAFTQGIFIPFGITTDDNAEGVRDGGFGSTKA